MGTCRERVLAGEFPELTTEESREADIAEQAWRVHVRQTGVSLLSGPPCVRPLPPPFVGVVLWYPWDGPALPSLEVPSTPGSRSTWGGCVASCPPPVVTVVAYGL